LAHALPDFITKVDQCYFTLPQNSLLPELFPDRVPIEYVARLQLRVLDVKNAVKSLSVNPGLKGRLSFDITDWVVSRDKLLHYILDIESGNIEVTTEHDSNAFVCNINTFTRLFSGALKTAQARELGLLTRGTPDMAQLCDSIFNQRVPYRSAIELG
jgi:predicted acetyltransferase